MENINADFKQLYDRKFRANVLANPRKFTTHLGNKEVIIKKNSKDIVYIVIPNQESQGMTDKDLISTAASGTAGTASTGGTLSSVSTATGSASTLLTFTTVATAGSASL